MHLNAVTTRKMLFLLICSNCSLFSNCSEEMLLCHLLFLCLFNINCHNWRWYLYTAPTLSNFKFYCIHRLHSDEKIKTISQQYQTHHHIFIYLYCCCSMQRWLSSRCTKHNRPMDGKNATKLLCHHH